MNDKEKQWQKELDEAAQRYMDEYVRGRSMTFNDALARFLLYGKVLEYYGLTQTEIAAFAMLSSKCTIALDKQEWVH